MHSAKSSSEIREEFGRYMQTERENRGISQKFLAEKIGISVTQLSRIENGKSGTERDTVIVWAKALGVDENEALRRFKPENIPPYADETYDILEGVTVSFDHKKMSRAEREQILEVMRTVAAGVKARNEDNKNDR